MRADSPLHGNSWGFGRTQHCRDLCVPKDAPPFAATGQQQTQCFGPLRLRRRLPPCPNPGLRVRLILARLVSTRAGHCDDLENLMTLAFRRLVFGMALAYAFFVPPFAARAANAEERPRLVVLVVFDQLRGDYLLRWEPYFGAGGF